MFRERWFSKTSSEDLRIILPNECKNSPIGKNSHSWVGLPDSTNNRAGCSVTFELQIINKSFCSISMPHLSAPVLCGIYLYCKITCCLSEIPVSLYLATLLGPTTTQKIPPPSQMLVEFFEMIMRETQQEDPLLLLYCIWNGTIRQIQLCPALKRVPPYSARRKLPLEEQLCVQLPVDLEEI